VGLVDTAADGRCPIVRGGTPPAAHFMRLTLDKLKPALLADRTVTAAEICRRRRGARRSGGHDRDADDRGRMGTATLTISGPSQSTRADRVAAS
jgi:hypothetical protein